MTPHKHAEVIKAWADGAEIEVRTSTGWVYTSNPSWDRVNEYRVKPSEPVTRKVKMLAWYDSATCKLLWASEVRGVVSDFWKRVPAEDKTIEVEK